MHDRWVRSYNVWNDPYYSTPASYRYRRDGRWYSVNQYGVDILNQAIRYGYEAGARAGQADRMDGWRPDWRGNYAYMDANYGYHGWHVDQREYNHYFREGFRRGYEDAYHGRSRYGRRSNGEWVILASVLEAIFGVQRHY
ncbi:MAG: hypothetical protein Q4F49_05915 [Pseudoxanthomonas suwonensis]|nr:hypothetical protein [Pseudoxanthomonas suwonensis]